MRRVTRKGLLKTVEGPHWNPTGRTKDKPSNKCSICGLKIRGDNHQRHCKPRS